MSGEFGSYTSGYFHSQMQYAAEDLAGGGDQLSREWAKFFEEFQHIAHAISWSEASDSGPDYPILETINRMPRLRTILSNIDAHVSIYKRVADEAVRQAVQARETPKAGE